MRRTLRTLFQPIAIAVALALLVRLAVQIYAIPSDSMAPTLYTGDRIIATRYVRGEPASGHVVVFTSPAGGETLVKRIVAVPGDLVDTRFGRLRIGARTIPEPYALEPAETGEIAPFIVPAGTYYVLGDNRRGSVDSRVWGVVPRAAIAGRARLVLWSSNASDPPVPANPAPAGIPVTARRGVRLFKWIQ
jgi:signal peptidase I